MSELSDDNRRPSGPGPPPRKKRVVTATLIDHTYIDYSTYRITNTDDSNRGQCSIENFPRKLHHILSRPEYHHIISWMPHGRAWKIWNKELLVSVVCKEQFKHEKFESFNRQVNGWGFKRLFGNGPDYKCYYNQFFLRGLPDLTSCMHRLDKPGKRLPNKLKEPDLYEISRRFPLPETNASIATGAPSKNDSYVLLYSTPLSAPCANRFSSKHHPAQMRSLSVDNVRSRSSASTVPKVVSRGSSDSKAFRSQTALKKDSDSLQDTPNPSVPVHSAAPSCQEMNNTPSLYKASQVGKVSSNSTGHGESYEHHGNFFRHTQDPYSYNKVFGSKESRYKRHQQEYPPSFHEKLCHPRKSRIAQFYSFDQDNKMNHHEAATAQSGCPGSTEERAHHPLQEQYESRHPAQQEQEQQLYYVPDTPGHIGLLHGNSVKHHDYNLTMNYAVNKHHPNKRQHHFRVQCQYKDRCLGHLYYAQDSQGHIDAYEDPFEHHHDESTVHYAQSSLVLDNHAPAAAKGGSPFSSRSQHHHQMQHHHKDQYISQQHEAVQDTLGYINAYNDPFNPHDYKSNENYVSNTQALDCPHHAHMGTETQHHLQPQHVCAQTNQCGTHPCKSSGGKLSALDKSFSSYIPEDRSPGSCHSLSPLSSLMDSFLDFEPLPSMFDENPKP